MMEDFFQSCMSFYCSRVFLHRLNQLHVCLKIMMFKSDIARELLCKSSISVTTKLLSERILLCSVNSWGSPKIAFTEKKPTTYNPSNNVTLFKATYFCPKLNFLCFTNSKLTTIFLNLNFRLYEQAHACINGKCVFIITGDEVFLGLIQLSTGTQKISFEELSIFTF